MSCRGQKPEALEATVANVRGYFTTSVERTRSIFRDGWADIYEEFGTEGVYLSTLPLDVNDGFDGDTT
jgi:hypothetical protein